MKKYSHWYDYIHILVNPHYWLMNYPYSEIWDSKLNKLMENNKFSNYTGYTSNLGDFEIWITNHPYASFTPYSCGKLDVRPSRITILRAHRKMVNDIVNEV